MKPLVSKPMEGFAALEFCRADSNKISSEMDSVDWKLLQEDCSLKNSYPLRGLEEEGLIKFMS